MATTTGDRNASIFGFRGLRASFSPNGKKEEEEEEMPPQYQEALNELESAARTEPLSSLSDANVLVLAREILHTLRTAKDEWTKVSDWGRAEVELLRLGGSAATGVMAQTRYQMGSVVGDFLATFVEALEAKIAAAGEAKGQKGSSEPELLRTKRPLGDEECCTVYGPVPLGSTLPGNTFEVWADADGGEGDGEEKEVDKVADGSSACNITVILGAGNQSILTIIDTLHNVLLRRSSVLVKHHPLRPFLADPYSVILSPLISRGYYRQVPDVNIGATTALLSDSRVNHVHITGSLATANAVAETLRRTRRPSLTSAEEAGNMITSELGCATPILVDDGRYTDVELSHVAQIIVFGKKTNGGCNCLSAQVVVLPRHWEQKDELRAKLLQELERQPTTPCYYPGSRERREEMVSSARKAGCRCTVVEAPPISDGTTVDELDQVTVIECGTPGEEGYNPDPLRREAFGPVLAIVELPGENRAERGKDRCDDDDYSYLRTVAVPFVNDKENIFGSLSCTIFTPASKSGGRRHDLEPVLADLEYGTIALNQWNAFGYGAAARGGMWGGHAAEKLGQSGRGYIGNQYAIPGDRLKTVVYGPSLETKPLFDLAKPPPPIVMDVMLELTCTTSTLWGMVRVVKMLLVRTVGALLAYVPGIKLLRK